jgi:hypothetical protein
MPAPQNNQGFVQPGSGGTGNWLGKLFGGIGDNYRARSMAQLQLELHGERAKIDTEHFKERQTHKAVVDAASKDYLGASGFKREKSRARFYKKEGANLSDVTQSSASGIAFQKKGLADRAQGSQQRVETPEQPTAGSSTPPQDRGSATTRRARGRAGTIKDVTEAMSSGKIDQEQAADISPRYAAKLGRATAANNVSTPAPDTSNPATPAARTPRIRKPKAGM